MPPFPAMAVLQKASQAAALLDPTRLRLLRELAGPEGSSAAGLARRVGIKRQLVNYHLRELEKAGLVELVAERRRGTVAERIVRACARSFVIDPCVLGELAADPARLPDRSSAGYLMALAAKSITEVAALRHRASDSAKSLGTVALQSRVRFATIADSRAFAEDLASDLAKLIAEYHDEAAPQGRWHSVQVGGYPMAGKIKPGLPSHAPPVAGVEGPFTDAHENQVT